MEPSEHDAPSAFTRRRAGAEAEVRAEAFDVYVAESGRRRLVDHVGPARVRLRSGAALAGMLTGWAEVADHLELVDAAGRSCLIPVASVASVVGSHARLRPEPAPAARTVSSWLRDAWALGRPMSVLDVTGEWHHGAVVSVASDHVVVAGDEVPVIVPYAAVEAWQT